MYAWHYHSTTYEPDCILEIIIGIDTMTSLVLSKVVLGMFNALKVKGALCEVNVVCILKQELKEVTIVVVCFTDPFSLSFHS